MIRPTYNVIFDEWYQAMDYKAVSTQEGKWNEMLARKSIGAVRSVPTECFRI